MMISGRSCMAATTLSRHGRVWLGGIRTLKSPAYRRMMAKKTMAGGGANGPMPTLLQAKEMPMGMQELDNETLVSLAAMKNHKARIEVLKRNIMVVDQVDYQTATETMEKIQESNHKGMRLAAIPYMAGIVTASSAAAASVPLCFYLPVVTDFNQNFVTTDVPEPADLETWLEVGSWAWNWMEPPLGTLSFMLLCLQFSRAQMVNLGIQPFTSYLKEKRATRLCREYPQYDKRILSEFSRTDHLMGPGK